MIRTDRQSNRLLRFSAVLVATCLFAFAAISAPAVHAAEGEWTDLLKGNELSKHWHTQGNWKLDDEGVVQLEPRRGESGWSRWDSYLWLNQPYEDFEIKFDYKLQVRGNSGFYFRVADKNDPVAQGIEVQIYESHEKGKDAKLTDHDSGGVIPGIAPKKNAAKPADEWNTFRITSKDNKLTIKLNGELVNEVDLTKPPLNTRPKKGFIGFQDHALPIALRNIRIREL